MGQFRPLLFSSPSPSRPPPLSSPLLSSVRGGSKYGSSRRTRRRPSIRTKPLEAKANTNVDAATGDEDDGGGGGRDAFTGSSSAASTSELAWACKILGLTESCSQARLKAAFRAHVKRFHPDVCKDTVDANAAIRRVIRAYEILSECLHHEDTEGACSDPFEEPECEAYDIFVNEVLCMGRGCPFSCVQRAPYAFSFSAEYSTARATSQGHGDDYQVQLAVGQCPKRCIHYVTPSQRAFLEDLLNCVLNDPYNMGEAALLESLIIKATSMNSKYQKPKRQPKVSTEYVDWL